MCMRCCHIYDGSCLGHICTTIEYSILPLYVGDRPKLYELQRLVGRNEKQFRIIEQTSPRWENLALALRFDGAVIEATRLNAHYQVERACQSILQKWLEGATSATSQLPVTWETLLVCLEDIELKTLATEIRAELLP